MKHFSSLIIVLGMAIGILCFNPIHAQNAVPRSFEKKVIRAEYLIFKKKYEAAEKVYEQALKEYIQDISAIRNYMELFPLSPYSSQRVEVLKRVAQQNNPKIIELVAQPLCQLLIQEEDWNGLRRYVHIFQSSLTKEHPLQSTLKFYAQLNGSSLKDNYEILPLGEAVNEDLDLKYPQLAFQEQQLIFTRTSPEHSGYFYTSVYDSCYGWTSPEMLDFPFNDIVPHEGFYVSPNSRYILFSKCDQKPYREQHGGGCDIYFSYYKEGAWSVPQPLGPSVNTYYDERYPVLSPDLKTLYFSSNRPGGYGGMDLYRSRFENERWQVAENLGSVVNSSGNEIAPFIFADNESLFFSSDGHAGFGGFDFFKVNISGENQEEVINLGPGINTYYDEIGMTISLEGRTAFFSSNRPQSSYSGFNLYQFKGDLGISAYQYIEGYVYDSLRYYPITNTRLKVEDRVEWPNSNSGDASYYLLKKRNAPLKIKIQNEGYVNTEVVFKEEDQIFNVDRNISLISEADWASLKDTISIRVPIEFLSVDFHQHFNDHWPEVVSFLAQRDIQHVIVNKIYYDQNGNAQIEDLYIKETINIEEAICPVWIPAHKLLFASDIIVEENEDAGNNEKKYYYEMNIISI